jgi:peptide deformylase
MALLNVCTYPDAVLRQEAVAVDKVDRILRKLMDDMVETMYDAPGIGLAANQVGKPIRLIVIDLQRPEEGEHGLIVLANPELVAAHGEIVCEEGCLSVPDFFAKVKRCEEVTVRGFNPDGRITEVNASGLLAVVLQHEMDHLNGRLFIDHLNPIKRDIFKRKWKKKLKQAKE